MALREFALTGVEVATVWASKLIWKTGLRDRACGGMVSPAVTSGRADAPVRSNTSVVNWVVSSRIRPCAPPMVKRPVAPGESSLRRGIWIQPLGSVKVFTGTLRAGAPCCGMVAVAPGLFTQKGTDPGTQKVPFQYMNWSVPICVAGTIRPVMGTTGFGFGLMPL